MLLDTKSFLSQATFCLTVTPKQQVLFEASMEPHTRTAIGNTREQCWAEKSHDGSEEEQLGWSGSEMGPKEAWEVLIESGSIQHNVAQ